MIYIQLTYFACDSALHNINKPTQLPLKKVAPTLQYCIVRSTFKSSATSPFWPLVKKKPKLHYILSTLREHIVPKYFGLQSQSTLISPRQTLLDQQTDTCTRSPPCAKKSLAEEEYGAKLELSQLCLAPSPAYPKSVHASHGDIIQMVPKSPLCCRCVCQKSSGGASLSLPLDPYTRENLSSAKLSHQLQHPLQKYKASRSQQDQQPNVPHWLLTPLHI